MILSFDELTGYPKWRGHEYAACNEELDPDMYEYLGFATSSPQAIFIKAGNLE